MELAVEPASISDLVEGIVGIMTPQAKYKSINVVPQFDASLPTIETDPGKVQQVLYNLLSNAVKFTPEGGEVIVSAERIVEGGVTTGVALSVTDTGPGIPEDMRDLIFEKFRQIDASHTREHSGTGLGLAICRELAEMLQADLSLVSAPGRGASFRLTLPVAYRPPKPRTLMNQA